MEEMGRFEGDEGRARRDAGVRAALSDPQTVHNEAVAEAELNIDYRQSPVVVGWKAEEEDPSLTNSGEVRSGSSPVAREPGNGLDGLGSGAGLGRVQAGDRLPDLGPVRAGEGEPEVRLHELTHRTGHTLLAVAVGDGGEELGHLYAQLEALVARSPLFDAAFALVTATDHLPYGSIHADAAAALGVQSLAVFAVRPDRHVGLVAEPASLADVAAYEALVTGR
jgi:hypothetical protein